MFARKSFNYEIVFEARQRRKLLSHVDVIDAMVVDRFQFATSLVRVLVLMKKKSYLFVVTYANTKTLVFIMDFFWLIRC